MPALVAKKYLNRLNSIQPSSDAAPDYSGDQWWEDSITSSLDIIIRDLLLFLLLFIMVSGTLPPRALAGGVSRSAFCPHQMPCRIAEAICTGRAAPDPASA